jgi:phosphatidylserine/phosphatidylglycerophosphate/cardiolipin synthase-like enzyme
MGWKTSDLEPTEEAFRRMASTAVERLVVMTPFLDVNGGEWLRRVLSAAQPGVRRILVLRSLEDTSRRDYPEGFTLLGGWLKEQQVEVYNYSIRRAGVSGRETFHAKVVLCDQSSAYVGSSNLNSASLSHSMEMGIAVTGRAARQVSIVMDSVLKAGHRYL